MKSCFMFGHATTPYGILPKIEQAIENHYTKYGITTFYVGSRGQFDSIAAIAAMQVKHPGNTRNLIEYAQRRQKKEGIIIENVAEST